MARTVAQGISDRSVTVGDRKPSSTIPGFCWGWNIKQPRGRCRRAKHRHFRNPCCVHTGGPRGGVSLGWLELGAYLGPSQGMLSFTHVTGQRRRGLAGRPARPWREHRGPYKEGGLLPGLLGRFLRAARSPVVKRRTEGFSVSAASQLSSVQNNPSVTVASFRVALLVPHVAPGGRGTTSACGRSELCPRAL